LPRRLPKIERCHAPFVITLTGLLGADVETKFKSVLAKVMTEMEIVIEGEIILAHEHVEFQLTKVT
jgi:hypothetical protein